jgi:DNA-binding GntR family transcriptional regulator
MMDAAPPPTETLSDRAYALIEEEIVTLRLAPGAVVSEAMLSTRMGIGRTPIREALQRLAREHLVQILPRRGIVVSEIDVVKQLRLIETRRELERLLVRSAARRASMQVREAFAAIAEGMDAAARNEDDIGFMRFDRAFNLLLLDAGGNEFAASALGLMNGLSRRFWFAHHQAMADLPLTARLHATIARAIAEGAGDAAAHASDALVDYIETVARRAIG